MFEVGKIFMRKQKVLADGEPAGSFDSVKNEQEVITFLDERAVGQTWRTPNGSELIITGKKKKSGRFEISLCDTGEETEKEQPPMSPEALANFLASGGYKLARALPPVAENSKVSAPEAAREVVEQPHQEEVSPMTGNEDEYVSLERETQEMIEKIEIISMAVGEILKKNIDTFGTEEYNYFLDQLDTLVRLINELTEEDEKLNDTANEPGQKITPELLEKKKENHRGRLDLFVELENLESAVKAEVEKTESLPETEPVPPVVPAEDSVDPLPEESTPVSSNPVTDITDINVYRKKASLRSAENVPMDPPFGGDISAKTETSTEQPVVAAVKTEDVPSGKKEAHRVSSNERRKAKERKNAELFETVSKALKEGQKFKKDGKPMLSIVAIAPQGIDIVYKKNATNKERFQPLTIKPSDIQDFLDYLKNTFEWILEKKERKASKPKTERKEEEVRQDTEPLDKDDAFRASMDQTAIPDYEDARSAERIAAAAATKAEKGADDIIQPEGEKMASGERTEEEWTLEDREKSLPAVKRKQCGSVVSEGLAPLIQQSEQNEGMTLRSLVDRIGIEKLTQSIAQSIVTILPVGLDWNEEERLLFATKFAEREIMESLE